MGNEITARETISAGSSQTVALKYDGTAVAVCTDNYYRDVDVHVWKDIKTTKQLTSQPDLYS